MSQLEDKIDRLTELVLSQDEKLDHAVKDIASVKQTMGGNKELGQKGHMEEFQTLKGDYYKTKSEVNKLGWKVSLIPIFISTGIAAMAAWFKSL